MSKTPSPWEKDHTPKLGEPMTPEMVEKAEQDLAGKLLKESALSMLLLEKLSKRGEGYQAYVRYPKDKSRFVCIGSIIGGHYSWNEQGYTVWVDAWERNPEWPRTNILGIKQDRRFGPVGEPATLDGIKTAIRLVNQAFPEYTEEIWVSNSIPVEIAVELGILGQD